MAQDERYLNLTKEQVNYINKIVDFSTKTKRQILLALDNLAEAAGGGGGGVDTYLELTDTTDSTFTGAAGKVPTVNVGETGLTFETPADTDTDAFLDLTDVTESSFIGAGGQAVTVNVGETGLEFSTIAGGSGFEWWGFNHDEFNDTPIAINRGYAFDGRQQGGAIELEFPEAFELTENIGGGNWEMSKHPVVILLNDGAELGLSIENTAVYNNYLIKLDQQEVTLPYTLEGDGLYYAVGYVFSGETEDLVWDIRRISASNATAGNAHMTGGIQTITATDAAVSRFTYKTNVSGSTNNTLQDGFYHGQLKKVQKTDTVGLSTITPTSGGDFVSVELDVTGDCMLCVWDHTLKEWNLVDVWNCASGDVSVTINT